MKKKTVRSIGMWLFFVVLLSLPCGLTSCRDKEPPLQKYTSSSFEYFDTVTLITGYEESREAFDAVSAEIMSQLSEYHKLFTIYTSYEGINNLCAINRLKDGVHAELTVDETLLDFIDFCKDVYEKTNGKNNIAMGAVLSIWHDCRTAGSEDPENAVLPSAEALEKAAAHTDINDVIVNREKHTVYLRDPEMTLDVGAVAKGYAVEKIAEYLEARGITGYCLNVGGNVRTLGSRGDGTPWKVGVENPQLSEDPRYLKILGITDRSLVISGSYQRYYVVDGKPYHHIIDPATLQPAAYYTSIAVLCHSSAMADALSTALFCMPVDEALATVESMQDTEAFFVLKDGTQCVTSGFERYVLSQ